MPLTITVELGDEGQLTVRLHQEGVGPVSLGKTEPEGRSQELLSISATALLPAAIAETASSVVERALCEVLEGMDYARRESAFRENITSHVVPKRPSAAHGHIDRGGDA